MFQAKNNLFLNKFTQTYFKYNMQERKNEKSNLILTLFYDFFFR
jgi:hypothetical protein